MLNTYPVGKREPPVNTLTLLKKGLLANGYQFNVSRHPMDKKYMFVHKGKYHRTPFKTLKRTYLSGWLKEAEKAKPLLKKEQ